MTPDQYVFSIVDKHKGECIPERYPLLSISTPMLIKAELEPSIRAWLGHYLHEIIISGSCAKGTAIKGTADVDLFISIGANIPLTLGDIYGNLYNYAVQMGWQPRKQNVSIGINYNGKKVDLVPGRIQSGYQNYHSLYRSKANSWTQTNIKEHIQIVKNSGRLTEIMALKIWRKCHGLEFPSIYLELTVLEALKYKPKNVPAQNFLAILGYLGEQFVNKTVIDPANSNNIISDDLYKYEKEAIAKKAKESLNQSNWGGIIW